MTLIGSGTITRKLVGSATLGTLAPTTTGGIEIDLLEGGDSASSFGGESPATVQITVRKDTNDNWVANNTILAAGEIGYIIEDKQFFVGDGTTAYTDLTDANYIVHLDDFVSALNSFDSRFTSIESNVSTLQSDLSDAQSDISALQSKTNDQDTFLSQLQLGLNDVVDTLSTQQSDLTDLGSEVSTLQSDLTTNVSALQGQIDTLSGGVMMKYTLQFNASDVPSVAGSPFTIITPTSGKTLLFIAACVSVICSSPSSKSLDFTFNNGATYANPITTISVPDDINATISGTVGLGLPYFTIDQILDLTLANSGVQSGDAQFTLMIFYMEV